VAHLIEVAFKGHRQEFFLWEGEEPPAVLAPVIVEVDRGEDLGHVRAVGDIATLRARGCTHGIGEATPTQFARRTATPDDLRRHAELRAQDDEARRAGIEMVRAHKLEMKLTDAEWRWDRRKLTFYFTAEKRVDFRTLVREMAAAFRTRIELKQIGVRDEAKRLDGIGRCGRQYCSAAWLPDLRPISLGLAKDQKLSLNPTQISGACGRLMCCLRYEHDWYVETRRRFPKEGKIIVTAQGEEKVQLNDLFRERVTLRRLSDGEARTIPLAQLDKELRGEPIETDDLMSDALPPDEWSEELLSMTDTVERPIPAMLRPPRPPKPNERPVTIARAPRAEQPRSESARPAAPRRERAPRNAKPTAPPPVPPASTTPTDPADASEAERAKSRRRRGRRGGRRGNSKGPSSGDTGGET
jgi:cell fate regulator YaaT (PSP1 superfamily)